jgi:3-hydroxybutyryl-CoA dehydrogenase
MSFDTIGVVGSGTMGNGIAHVFALAGLKVCLVDIRTDLLELAVSAITKNLDRQLKRETITAAQRQAALAAITTSTDMAAFSGCSLVVEAVTESRDLKKKIFAGLEDVVSPDCILASNTSTISLSELAGQLRSPRRFIGMHFMNPAPLMQLVEVITAIQTAEATTAAIVELSGRIGKTAVVVRDSPGFVLNRILIPMINEAVCALDAGIADAAAIDSCMKLGANHPIGPLALADLIGLDVCLTITEVLFADFSDPKYRPSPLLRRMVAAHMLGRKSGTGFFTYD